MPSSVGVPAPFATGGMGNRIAEPTAFKPPMLPSPSTEQAREASMFKDRLSHRMERTGSATTMSMMFRIPIVVRAWNVQAS